MHLLRAIKYKDNYLYEGMRRTHVEERMFENKYNVRQKRTVTIGL